MTPVRTNPGDITVLSSTDCHQMKPLRLNRVLSGNACEVRWYTGGHGTDAG